MAFIKVLYELAELLSPYILGIIQQKIIVQLVKILDVCIQVIMIIFNYINRKDRPVIIRSGYGDFLSSMQLHKSVRVGGNISAC